MYTKISITALILAGSMMAVGFGMSGCTAVNTAIEKKDLNVQTQMSQTVFLEPRAPKERIIYFDFRNTSDKDINIRSQIETAFINRGYKITQDPDEANYMLQGNILKVGESNLRDSQIYLRGGYGGAGLGTTGEEAGGAALTGAAMGAGATYALGGDSRTTVAMGLVGAAAGVITNALVKDVMYVMVTDLQIRERPQAGEIVTQTQQGSMTQGNSAGVYQNVQKRQVGWKIYNVRIVSTANKANLKFEEAEPTLENALIRSVSGIF